MVHFLNCNQKLGVATDEGAAHVKNIDAVCTRNDKEAESDDSHEED